MTYFIELPEVTLIRHVERPRPSAIQPDQFIHYGKSKHPLDIMAAHRVPENMFILLQNFNIHVAFKPLYFPLVLLPAQNVQKRISKVPNHLQIRSPKLGRFREAERYGRAEKEHFLFGDVNKVQKKNEVHHRIIGNLSFRICMYL